MTGNGRAPQDQAQSLAKAGALIKATLDAGDQFRRSRLIDTRSQESV